MLETRHMTSTVHVMINIFMSIFLCVVVIACIRLRRLRRSRCSGLLYISLPLVALSLLFAVLSALEAFPGPLHIFLLAATPICWFLALVADPQLCFDPLFFLLNIKRGDASSTEFQGCSKEYVWGVRFIYLGMIAFYVAILLLAYLP